MAKLYFKYGAMGSSKTAQALITKFNYEERGMKVWLLKPSTDQRDGIHMLHSRIGLEAPAEVIGPEDDIYELYTRRDHPDVVITDECQFFTPQQIDQLRRLVDEQDLPVLCFGLRTDFLTHLFPGSLRLFELADSITEIKTICACGSKATVNARIDGNGHVVTKGEQVFLGGMAVPAVVRFGYGFVQGVDAAATEGKLTDVKVEYVYGNKFAGDPDITAYMDNWYKTLGVQAVFACGGGIYTSAAEAAAKVKDAKVIGVDTDQSAIIDKDYGKGMTLTSAMKGLAPTVKHMLSEVVAGNFSNYGGKIETLGLVSGDDTETNYVQLPLETTQWGDGFTKDDYKALVADMYNGKITVSNDVKNQPAVKTAQVQYYDNIK